MGIPAEHIPKSLVGDDHASMNFFTGNFPVEIADHGEYHFRNFREKLSVVEEEHTKGFWEGKDKLAMRKAQQDFLIKVFGKEERPFLAAGGAGHSLRSLPTHASWGTDKTPYRRSGGSNRDRIPDCCSGYGLDLAKKSISSENIPAH